MTSRKWTLTATFYSDTPADDLEADEHADNLSDWIETALLDIPAVESGSVAIIELDTVPEYPE